MSPEADSNSIQVWCHLMTKVVEQALECMVAWLTTFLQSICYLCFVLYP